jgi:hypothetical protein
MRTFAIALAIFLVVLFIGGAVNLGRAPLFEHLDTALGTDALMDLHHGVFFFLNKGGREYERTSERVKEFQDKPIGIDNKRKYRQLDDAAKN